MSGGVTVGSVLHPASARRRRRPPLEYRHWALVGPALFLFLALLVSPMLNLLAQSFLEFRPNVGIIPRLTVANYTTFLTDPFYLGVLARTLRLAVIVAVVCVAVGYPVAYQLARTEGRRRAYLTLVVASPLLISVIVRTFGWLVILGPNGLINALLQWLHLIDEPQRLLFTEGAVVVGLVHVFLPFMILSITASLERIDPSLERAARNLGASPRRAFWRITLPLSLPGVLAGTVIVFALSTSAFVTPAILGGSQIKVMSALIYQQNLLLLNWPFGGAMSVIILLITSGVTLGYTRLLEGGRYRVVFQ
ncbi:MAG: ABC transporter permease [Candidatus Rokubacteria bacterium]|nr:ABC transporter permease [Candidatus Rokubacteria bacterium]MBI3104804.1 ABC transporter permease [Candidatus Rokubacteria bacterium]